jgi:AcrR family transcriptional regulator
MMSLHEDDLSLEEMRSRIVKAASELYEKKGRETSVEEIATAASVSVPVTYQFVKKPADIMLLIVEDWQRDFMERVSPVIHDAGLEPIKKLSQAVAHYFKVVDQQRSKVMMLYRGSRRLDDEGRRKVMVLEIEAVEVFKGILEEGLKAGAFKTADTGLTAYNIVMLGHMWSLKSWHFKRLAMDIDDYIDAQMENILSMVKA